MAMHPQFLLFLVLYIGFVVWPVSAQGVSAVQLGSWRGVGGDPHDMPALMLNISRGIKSMVIRAGQAVDAFGFSTSDDSRHDNHFGPWGGKGGVEYTWVNQKGVSFDEIFGTTGMYDGKQSLTSLGFRFSDGSLFGPYGTTRGTAFSVRVWTKVVGFFGRSGRRVDALGVYLT